ncbi:MAG: D-aminoacylase [Armatimonadetes bacterium]|nr:D-aminoacylase [Armatimonadota bacterium]
MEIIAGGALFDGTGAPGQVADVAIDGDVIVAVGDLSAMEAPRLDARGLFVAPGFVDLHTHTDATVLLNPSMSSSIRQGVTTELTGNCGMQVGLSLNGPPFSLERRLSRDDAGFEWSSLAEFVACIERQGIAGNLAALVGHGTLRKRVMGWDPNPPDGEAMAQMRRLLCQALEEGAFGFSTGLEYSPGRFATPAELAALAREVAAVDGVYATHLRNEAEGLLEAVEEAIGVARESGVALQLSHHKAEGRRNWGRVERTLARIEEARAAGMDVACDVYPYAAFMTGLGVRTLPAWVQGGSADELAERLRDPDTRTRVLADMQGLDLDWGRLQIAVARKDRSLQGRSLAEIARERGLTPQEAVIDVLAGEGGMVAGISFEIAEEDVRAVMRFPHASIISDSGARAANGPLAEDRVHPRGFGTFPRALGRYVREERVLTWEAAIHKMTSLPAARIGLRRRGLVRPGAYADLVVFDPETVSDRATFADPIRYPEGIRHVFVNGVGVVRDGEETGARPGRVIRRGE